VALKMPIFIVVHCQGKSVMLVLYCHTYV